MFSRITITHKRPNIDQAPSSIDDGPDKYIPLHDQISILTNALILSLYSECEFAVLDYFCKNDQKQLISASDLLDISKTNKNFQDNNVSIRLVDRTNPYIELISARYGLADNDSMSEDITDKIKLWMDKNFCTFAATNFKPENVFGDPYPGVPKNFFFQYKLGKSTKYLKFSEDEYSACLFDYDIISNHIWGDIKDDKLHNVDRYTPDSLNVKLFSSFISMLRFNSLCYQNSRVAFSSLGIFSYKLLFCYLALPLDVLDYFTSESIDKVCDHIVKTAVNLNKSCVYIITDHLLVINKLRSSYASDNIKVLSRHMMQQWEQDNNLDINSCTMKNSNDISQHIYDFIFPMTYGGDLLYIDHTGDDFNMGKLLISTNFFKVYDNPVDIV
jgi:hypothetical protein